MDLHWKVAELTVELEEEKEARQLQQGNDQTYQQMQQEIGYLKRQWNKVHREKMDLHWKVAELKVKLEEEKKARQPKPNQESQGLYHEKPEKPTNMERHPAEKGEKQITREVVQEVILTRQDFNEAEVMAAVQYIPISQPRNAPINQLAAEFHLGKEVRETKETFLQQQAQGNAHGMRSAEEKFNTLLNQSSFAEKVHDEVRKLISDDPDSSVFFFAAHPIYQVAIPCRREESTDMEALETIKEAGLNGGNRLSWMEVLIRIKGESNEEGAGAIVAPLLNMSTTCLLYTSPSPRDQRGSRMPSSA